MIRGNRISLGALALLAGAALNHATMARAEEWGTLKGRLIVEGATPAPVALKISQNAEVCGKHNLVNEDLVVDAKGDLANAVIYVRDKSIDVNPEYAKTAKSDVVLDNKDCRFEPHVLVMRTTQTLVLKNSDPVGHNTNVTLLKNTSFNDMLPPNAEMTKSGLSSEELTPLKVACNIHPWMQGIILIRANPYFAVSKADGTFEIKDLPAGKPIEFQFWQEKAGNLKSITGADGFATDAKGRVKLTLKPGVTDLGDIKIPASAFAK